jgi:hypothetical protein
MTGRRLSALLVALTPTLVWAAAGSVNLIDSSGLDYFINTDITNVTTSSASGAASEASYTTAVAATTSGGLTAASQLTDAFDGYNGLCLFTGSGTPPACSTGDPDFTVYNNNGAATLDASCNDRQVIFNPQTIGDLTLVRKVFVPINDEFARWLDFVTNTGTSTESVTLVTSNNLGSDSGTVVVNTSDGDAVAEVTDRWVTTFADYDPNTGLSPDPRLGHVLRGSGGSVGLAAVDFADGSDKPFWAYTFSLAAGETAIIMNFVTGQPSQSDAAAKAESLSKLEGKALDCMSRTEKSEVVNFHIRTGGGGGGGCNVSPVTSSGTASRGLPLVLLGGLLLAGWLRRHVSFRRRSH